MVKQRSKALGVVLGCGFLLLVSLAVSSVIVVAGKFFSGPLPIPEFVMQAVLFLVALAVITGVFSVLFKYLPDAEVQWHDVLIGAGFTALLFTIGKFAIGMYLGKASFGSTYGAAGSLVIVLVWVYYSAQIFFFGAEFTQLYAEGYGSNPGKVWEKPTNVRVGKRAEKPAAAYAEPVAQQATALNRPAAAAGSLLGSALAIAKIVGIFRRSR